MMVTVSSAALVAIATRGRPRETYALLDRLAAQSLSAHRIAVVGAGAEDVAGLEQHPLTLAGAATVVISGRPGLTAQRNVALEVLAEELKVDGRFVAFFDDDFCPAPDWLAACAAAFSASPDLAGVTGHVLGDGVRGPALTEAAAERLIAGLDPPLPHWSNVGQIRDVESLYGCNMAFAAQVCRSLRFDEALPLYGWQEDCDFTGQARRFGRTVIAPGCRGVHLGVKAGRTSGVKFGYSQIANPIHIARRQNMSSLRAARFMLRALAANALRSVGRHALFDYRGRLAGNAMALADLVLGRCAPSRILSLK